jgi:hypothetical protein
MHVAIIQKRGSLAKFKPLEGSDGLLCLHVAKHFKCSKKEHTRNIFTVYIQIKTLRIYKNKHCIRPRQEEEKPTYRKLPLLTLE